VYGVASPRGSTGCLRSRESNIKRNLIVIDQYIDTSLRDLIVNDP
jgi:hypothetical protein